MISSGVESGLGRKYCQKVDEPVTKRGLRRSASIRKAWLRFKDYWKINQISSLAIFYLNQSICSYLPDYRRD